MRNVAWKVEKNVCRYKYNVVFQCAKNTLDLPYLDRLVFSVNFVLSH